MRAWNGETGEKKDYRARFPIGAGRAEGTRRSERDCLLAGANAVEKFANHVASTTLQATIMAMFIATHLGFAWLRALICVLPTSQGGASAARDLLDDVTVKREGKAV